MAKSIKEYIIKVGALRGWYSGKRSDDMESMRAAINRNADILASMIELYEANRETMEGIIQELRAQSYDQITKEAADRL